MTHTAEFSYLANVILTIVTRLNFVCKCKLDHKQPIGINFCEHRPYNELHKGWTAARIQLYVYLSHIVHYIA